MVKAVDGVYDRLISNRNNIVSHRGMEKTVDLKELLTLFDLGFFEPSVMGGGGHDMMALTLLLLLR